MGPSSPSPMGEVWTILKESSSFVTEESRDRQGILTDRCCQYEDISIRNEVGN